MARWRGLLSIGSGFVIAGLVLWIGFVVVHDGSGAASDQAQIISVLLSLWLLLLVPLRHLLSVLKGGLVQSDTVALGGSRDFTPLGGRSYTGFIPSDPSTHIADSAVYVRSSAPFWHSYIMIGITFWVHSLIQTEDMEVWNRQSYRPGGSYYDEFWNWFQQFQSPIADPENQPLA